MSIITTVSLSHLQQQMPSTAVAILSYSKQIQEVYGSQNVMYCFLLASAGSLAKPVVPTTVFFKYMYIIHF